MFENVGRQVGVATPKGQGQERGSPQTVAHAVRCSMVATQFFDEYGREHNAVLLEVGGKLYLPPNAEAWASSLKACSEWLFKGVTSKLQVQDAVAPTEDTVDVLAAAKAVVEGT